MLIDFLCFDRDTKNYCKVIQHKKTASFISLKLYFGARYFILSLSRCQINEYKLKWPYLTTFSYNKQYNQRNEKKRKFTYMIMILVSIHDQIGIYDGMPRNVSNCYPIEYIIQHLLPQNRGVTQGSPLMNLNKCSQGTEVSLDVQFALWVLEGTKVNVFSFRSNYLEEQ